MRKVFKTCTIDTGTKRELILRSGCTGYYIDYDNDMYMVSNRSYDSMNYRRQENLRIHQEARRLP